MNIIHATIFVFMAVGLVAKTSFASGGSPHTESRNPTSEIDVLEGGKPYCGIYCIYAAARRLGVQGELAPLIDRRYVSTFEGSSVDDLVNAASIFGLSATHLQGIGVEDIEKISSPALLHVLSDSASGRYDHWILSLGNDQGGIKIFDPPGTVSHLSAGSLLERWDNNAIVISRSPYPTAMIRLRGFVRDVALFAVAVLILYTCHRVRKMFRLSDSMYVEVGLLVGVVAGLSILTSKLSVGGLLFRTDAGRIIEGARAGMLCRRVAGSDLNSMLAARSVHVVDARPHSDYILGTIPSAVNLPATSDGQVFRLVSKQLSTSDRIVVFCESDDCAYSAIIAGRFVSAGFESVSILSGGWEEWSKTQWQK